MNLVFVEDIYQAYVSGGNLHLMCENTTGETSASGQDKLEITAKIVMPVEKAVALFPEIIELLSNTPVQSPSVTESSPLGQGDSKYILGNALEFDITSTEVKAK